MPDSAKLSLLERYAYTRSQLGFPQCISFVIAYRDPPSASLLRDRLSSLQAAWPHLCDQIEEGPDGPIWTEGKQRDDLVASHTATGTLGEMLEIEQARFKASSKPLSVTCYPHHLGVTVSHELADGLGSLRLLHAVLGSAFQPEPRPPRLEDVVNLGVPLTTMMGVVFHKLLLPKLPTFISSYFPPEKIWPLVSAPSMTCKDNLSLLSLSPDLFDKITHARDQHGLPSIHAVIQTAWTLALRSVTQSPVTFTACTPRSERQPGLPSLGNYVTALSFRFTPELLAQPFWSLATAVSEHIKSAAAIQSGRQSVGMLAHVPKDWVQFWREQTEEPYGDSWELSNLGRIELPSGATDMAWAQPGAIFGPAINVSMLRHEGGLRLCVTWRAGSAVDEGVVREVEAAFYRIIDGF